MSERWRKAITGGAVFLAVGIGGLVVADMMDGPTPERDDATQEVTAAGNEQAMSMRVGDCFDNVDAEEFETLPVVPCADAHDNEVYHSFTMDEGDWPSDEAFETAMVDACDPEFDRFVGISYEDSTLDWSTLQPTESGWNDYDDREVQCVIYDPAGPVEGTLESARR